MIVIGRSHTIAPEIPEYVLLLESVFRPFVMTIALGLIWLGAARMPASARSHYTTAVVLSAVLLGWEAAAQYLGEANTYLATIENPPVVPTILFGLLNSARCRRHCAVAVGKHRETSFRDPAPMARGGSGLSRRGRYIPCALGRRTDALAIRSAGGHW